VVGRLTKFQEQKVSGDRAWKMSDAPRDYMEQMLDNIVAFRIDIDSISAKSKFSQNREMADFDGVVRAMETVGRKILSVGMRRIRGNDE
jgi:transcriptional regulator